MIIMYIQIIGTDYSTPHPIDLEYDVNAVKRALKEGKVTLKLIKCLCQGPARVGKTHLKCLLLGIKLDSTPTPSTGIEQAEKVIHIRNVATGKYCKTSEGSGWKFIDGEGILQVLAEELKKANEKSSQKINTMASCATAPQVKQAIESQAPVIMITENAPKDEENMAIEESVIGDIPIIEDIRERIDRSENFELDTQEWVYFVDSGGQPQFQDILQAFIPDTSVLIVAMKLTEKLSDCPMMNYCSKDGSTHCQGQHALTNQEILERLVRILKSTTEKKEIIVVGTYYDEYSKRKLRRYACDETIEEKNQIIGEVFLPLQCSHNVIFKSYDLTTDHESYIFPVNGLQAERGEFNDPVISDLRSRIIEQAKQVNKVEVPLRWFAFELLLQREASKMNKQVFSYSECLNISKSLHIFDDDVQHVLSYLSSYNIILYYKDVLPNVVFATPQVLLDKVAKLTEMVYRLSSNSGSHSADTVRMCKYGFVSVDILRGIFRDDRSVLFTEKEFIEVLKHLYLISQLENGDYFMPSLLPPCAPSEIKRDISNQAILVLHFEDSCAPAGLFCAVVVALSSKSMGWKPDNKKFIKQQHRNAVTFAVQQYGMTITLIDSFNQFEVHHDNRPGYEQHLFEVKNSLVKIVSQVIENRKFNVDCPEISFFCRFCPLNSLHVAVVGKNRRFLICRNNFEHRYIINSQETSWLGNKSVSFVVIVITIIVFCK